jgi:hypothetical protein
MKQGKWLSLVALALSAACTPHVATLSGTVVVAGGPAKSGVAQAPVGATPLAVQGSDDACLPRASFDRLGPPCNQHETQGGATPVMTDDLTPGRHRTEDETAWYCRGDAVVRLVLRRCETTSTYRIVDVAVSLGEKH